AAQPSLRGDLYGALGYFANWHMLGRGSRYADLFAAPSPVVHFWSLAIEEQFYIVFPVLVAAVLALRRGSRPARFLVLRGLACATVSLQFVLNDGDRLEPRP